MSDLAGVPSRRCDPTQADEDLAISFLTTDSRTKNNNTGLDSMAVTDMQM